MTLRKYAAVWTAGLFLTVSFVAAQAQTLQKGVTKLPQALGKNAAREAAAIPAAWSKYPAILPAAAAHMPAAAPLAAPSSLKARAAQKFPGAVVKYEQRVNGLSLHKALRRVVELRGVRPPNGWPKTLPHSITVPDLTGLTLDGFTDILPAPPVPTNKIYLYRGMGLDGDALRNMLQNGLRPEDAGQNANDLGRLMRMGSMGTMPVTQDMMKDLDVKQINLATNSVEPASYAARNSFENGRIPVVVTVRGWRNPNYQGYHLVTETIPPADFVEVSIFIQGPSGTPLWCRVTLAEDGHSFVIAPYSKQP